MIEFVIGAAVGAAVVFFKDDIIKLFKGEADIVEAPKVEVPVEAPKPEEIK